VGSVCKEYRIIIKKYAIINMVRFSFTVLFVLCINAAAGQANKPPIKIWKQKSFVLSAFNVLNDDTTQYKKALQLTKAAGINLVELTYLSRPNLDIALKIAEEVGVRVIAEDHSLFSGRSDKIPQFTEDDLVKGTASIKQNKMLTGYYVWDEPHQKDFDTVRLLRDVLKKNDPGRLAFSVIFPSYGMFVWRDSTYPKYVDAYLKTVDPEVVSFDYYPYMNKTDSLRNNNIWKDFGYIRKKALEAQKPLWFYFQAVPLPPNEVSINLAMVRAQMYCALTYGVKGLSYYYENKKGVLLDSNFNKSPLYNNLKSLNKQVKNIGNFLLKKDSEKIYHTGLTKNNDLSGAFCLDKIEEDELIDAAPANLVLGVFGDSTAKKYLMVTNMSHTTKIKSGIILKKKMKIAMFDKSNNKQVVLQTASRSLPVSLAPGEAVLYVLQ
jgi:hypothetical protein